MKFFHVLYKLIFIVCKHCYFLLRISKYFVALSNGLFVVRISSDLTVSVIPTLLIVYCAAFIVQC